MMSWRMFFARSAVASAMVGFTVFVGIHMAKAESGGPTRSAFTFAGVLRGSSGAPLTTPTMLTFTFHRTGVADCVAPAVMASPNSTGAFSVLVPIDACASTFFDGADITYDIAQAGESTPIAVGVPITPVPYARFADQAGVNNACPAGYSRSTNTADAMYTVCVRRRTDSTVYDEVVKVGTGASSFWVDRYEASAWQYQDGSGMQYGAESRPNFPGTFPQNGQATAPVFACSVNNVVPTASITWFQADAACRASGKRLLDRDEWFAASRGTPDPGSNAGVSGRCITMGSALRATGLGTNCLSFWGVQDMIGNLSEWTNEWYAGLNTAVSDPTAVWPDIMGISYGGDGTWNITSRAYPGGGVPYTQGLPAAAVRGGNWASTALAGVFSLNLQYVPSAYDTLIGFRCAVAR